MVLYLVKRLYERISVVNFSFLVISLFFSLLAGYIQGFFYIYISSFAYFVFLSKSGKFKIEKLTFFAAAHVLPIILGAFQLLPTYELFNLSSRGSYSLSQISNLLLPPYYWVTAFASDFFGNPATRNYFINGTYIERVMYAGIPILFFAGLALRFIKTNEVKFFTLVGGLALLLTTDLPGVKYFYLLPIPVVSTTVPTRELSVFIFAIIVLGAMGLNFFLSKEKTRTRLPIFFILLYILFWAAAYYLKLEISLKNLILPSALAFATVILFYNFKRFKNLGPLTLGLIVIFDLLYFFNKITPFSPTALIYPKTQLTEYLKENADINRFWGYGDAYIKPNFQTVDKTYSPEGVDPLHIAFYTELLASSKEGIVPKVLPRPDANIAPGYGLTDLRDNYHRQRILNLLGVKYVLHKSDGSSTFPSETYHKVFQTESGWEIYENRNVLPRFFMAGDYEVAENKEDVLLKIYDQNINLRDTLILENEPSLKVSSKGDVRLISYKPQRVEFRTESNGNSLLFLSDNYYPEWKARIDGNDAKVLVANYSFRAVEVSEGEHNVEFYYYPEKFLLGLKISLLGLVGLVLSLIFIKYVKK
jgi:hypothetical protein